MAARSQKWKALEKTSARKLRGRRIVRQDFFESSPDVVVEDFSLVVERKSRKNHAFHAFLQQAQKYCLADETPVLITKSANQIGEFATLPLDTLAELLDEIRHARLNSRIRTAEIAKDRAALSEALREKVALRKPEGGL